MGYDMLEAMEWKNGNMCDDSDYSYGVEYKIDDDS